MLLVSIILCCLSVYFLIKKKPKVLIAIIGLVWCEFYAFGLCVIQGQYTDMLPKKNIRWVGGFLSTILVLMIPLWILRMIPNIAANKPAETYGVFVMDLGIVFPAIGILLVPYFGKLKIG